MLLPLERESQSKLNLSGSLALRQSGDLPDTGSNWRIYLTTRQLCRARVNRHTRRRLPALDVEDVEGFHTELQLHAFAERDALEHREVNIIDGRPTQDVSRKCSERAKRSHECARIEPGGDGLRLIRSATAVRDRLLTIRIRVRRYWPGYERISDLVGPKIIVRSARSAAAQVRQVAGNDQVKGSTSPRLGDKVCLPITQNPGSGTTGKPPLSFSKRRLV